MQILGVSGLFGIFQLLKRARGRRPQTVTIETSQKVTLTFDGDEPISVDKAIYQLFNNPRARKALELIVRPLLTKGVEFFRVRHNGTEMIEVASDEVPFFTAPTENEGETTSEVGARVVLLPPSFKPGCKWRVHDGSRSIFASIADDSFQSAVQSGAEAFRKGDILHVRLQTRQWVDGSTLKAEYAITKVFRHETGPQQQTFL